uniref:AAA+ ATPase domain-containing protein n=1 Tax=Aureoumbra lagunensis TaxID=44058 RepID=A0A7S3NHP5_9STRA
MSLKKIKLQLEKTCKGGAGKKKKKNGSSKKKKGGGKKKGGNKKKKGKLLPGDKLAELKNISAEEMVAALIESRLINKYRTRRVFELIGDFNYLGTVQQHTESQQTEWKPPIPSMAQLRAAITEYCILPLGSSTIKSAISNEFDVKSIMLYGPSGAGKTMMAEAIATELGALLINISPSRIKAATQFSGKTGPVRLIHMICALAKDPNFAPIVVYIDQCEQFFGGADSNNAENGGLAKKNVKNIDKEGTNPARFKKDLILYKNALEKHDRIIFIGVTSAPEKGETKEYKAFFDKFLHMPFPDYPSRLMIWKNAIQNRIQHHTSSHHYHNESSYCRDPIEHLDLSTLAQISQGFSAGSICYTVKKTLTARRVQRLDKLPASEAEFLNTLAQQSIKLNTGSTSFDVYHDFTAKITGLNDEKNRVKNEKDSSHGMNNSGNATQADGKKKSSSKKKK